MFRCHADGNGAELSGKTEYGEDVVLELSPMSENDAYDLLLTVRNRAPRRFKLLARDVEFLGNKIQLKGPYLRIVVDTSTREKFCEFIRKR